MSSFPSNSLNYSNQVILKKGNRSKSTFKNIGSSKLIFPDLIPPKQISNQSSINSMAPGFILSPKKIAAAKSINAVDRTFSEENFNIQSHQVVKMLGSGSGTSGLDPNTRGAREEIKNIDSELEQNLQALKDKKDSMPTQDDSQTQMLHIYNYAFNRLILDEREICSDKSILLRKIQTFYTRAISSIPDLNQQLIQANDQISAKEKEKEQSISSLQEDIRRLQVHISQLEDQINQKDFEIKKVIEESNQKDVNLSSLQYNADYDHSKIINLQFQLRKKKEKIHRLQDTIKQQESENKEQLQHLETLSQELEDYQSGQSSYVVQTGTLKTELEKAHEEMKQLKDDLKRYQSIEKKDCGVDPLDNENNTKRSHRQIQKKTTSQFFNQNNMQNQPQNLIFTNIGLPSIPSESNVGSMNMISQNQSFNMNMMIPNNFLNSSTSISSVVSGNHLDQFNSVIPDPLKSNNKVVNSSYSMANFKKGPNVQSSISQMNIPFPSVNSQKSKDNQPPSSLNLSNLLSKEDFKLSSETKETKAELSLSATEYQEFVIEEKESLIHPAEEEKQNQNNENFFEQAKFEDEEETESSKYIASIDYSNVRCSYNSKALAKLPNLVKIVLPFFSLAFSINHQADLNIFNVGNFITINIVKNQKPLSWGIEIIHDYFFDPYIRAFENYDKTPETAFSDWIHQKYKLHHVVEQAIADFASILVRYAESPDNSKVENKSDEPVIGPVKVNWLVKLFHEVLLGCFSHSQVLFLATLYTFSAQFTYPNFVDMISKREFVEPIFIDIKSAFAILNKCFTPQIADSFMREKIKEGNPLIEYSRFLRDCTHAFGDLHQRIYSQAKILLSLCGCLDCNLISHEELQYFLTFLGVKDPKRCIKSLQSQLPTSDTPITLSNLLTLCAEQQKPLMELLSIEPLTQSQTRFDNLKPTSGELYRNFLVRYTQLVNYVMDKIEPNSAIKLQKVTKKLRNAILFVDIPKMLWMYRIFLNKVESITLNERGGIPYSGDRMTIEMVEQLKDYFNRTENVSFALLE